MKKGTMSQQISSNNSNNNKSTSSRSSQTITIVRKKRKNMSHLLARSSSSSSSFLSYSCMLLAFLFLFCILIDTVTCDYENTWNFYYEQPCCGTGGTSNSGPHHLRHHRDNTII
uniref:CSON000679 protein n=1 Tax=Culicoides sonorensis TaxID=179676 RepID=A0A336MJD2_CULSO